MIPLANVRAMLAAATPGPWDNGALQVYSVAGCPLHGPGGNPLADASVSRCACRVVVNSARDDDRPLIAAAPDLAAQVLTLAAALETAERERDEARTDAARLRGEVEGAHRAASHARQERTVMAEELTTVREERDTARSALDGLVAAVRAEREAEAAHAEAAVPIDPRDAFTSLLSIVEGGPPSPEMAALAAAGEAREAARKAVDALLAAAPPRTTVDARVVREYLAAASDAGCFVCWAGRCLSIDDPEEHARVEAAFAKRHDARAALDATGRPCPWPTALDAGEGR